MTMLAVTELESTLLGVAAVIGFVTFCCSVLRWIGRLVLRLLRLHWPAPK